MMTIEQSLKLLKYSGSGKLKPTKRTKKSVRASAHTSQRETTNKGSMQAISRWGNSAIAACPSDGVKDAFLTPALK